MADFNEIIIDPKTFYLKSKVCLDPSTVLTVEDKFASFETKKMFVANGSTIQVYDVTDPSNPVLIGTIG